MAARFSVVELRSRVRATGYGVWDDTRGWICATFMFAEIGVARAERAALAYAAAHNAVGESV